MRNPIVFRSHLVARLLLAMSLAAIGNGCSFMFARGPGPADGAAEARQGTLNCSTTYVAPTLDILLMAFQVFRTVIAVQRSDADYRGAPLSRGTDIGFGVGLTLLQGSSAIYGFNVVGACRDLDASRPGPSSARRRAEEREEEGAVEARRARQAPFVAPTPAGAPVPVPPPPATPVQAPAPAAPVKAPAPAAPDAPGGLP